MSNTPAAPDMDATPPGGGSYTRLPDGSLVRNDDSAQVDLPSDRSDPQPPVSQE